MASRPKSPSLAPLPRSRRVSALASPRTIVGGARPAGHRPDRWIQARPASTPIRVGVRFTKNYWVDELRHLTGKNQAVAVHVLCARRTRFRSRHADLWPPCSLGYLAKLKPFRHDCHRMRIFLRCLTPGPSPSACASAGRRCASCHRDIGKAMPPILMQRLGSLENPASPCRPRWRTRPVRHPEALRYHPRPDGCRHRRRRRRQFGRLRRK